MRNIRHWLISTRKTARSDIESIAPLIEFRSTGEFRFAHICLKEFQHECLRLPCTIVVTVNHHPLGRLSTTRRRQCPLSLYLYNTRPAIAVSPQTIAITQVWNIMAGALCSLQNTLTGLGCDGYTIQIETNGLRLLNH